MKIKKNKVLLITGLLISSALSTSIAIPLANTTKSINNDVNVNSVSHNAKVTSTTDPSHIINISGNDPSETTQKSYYAMSKSNDSYAILTASTNSSTTPDQITKYSLFDTNPGNAHWVIKKDKLKTDTGSSDVSVTIRAIQYSSGSLLTTGYLYVLVTDTTKAYILQYDWQSGQLVTNKKVTIASGNNIKDFVVADDATDSLLLFEASKITTANQAQTIKFYNVNNTHFSNASTTPTTQTLTISQAISNSNFSNNMYLRDYEFISGNLILAYQADAVAANVKSHAIVKIKFNNGTLAESNLKSNNAVSYTLTTDDVTKFGNSKKLSLALVDKGDATNFSVIVKAKTDAATGSADNNDSILVSNFKVSDLGLTTTRQDNYPTKGGYILQVAPLYGDNATVTGFLALDSSNKVISLTKDLNVETILASFTQQTVYYLSTSTLSYDWFPQDTDGTIGDYYRNTLIGKLGTTTANFTEILANYSLLSNDELSPSVKYRKVSSDGSSLDSTMNAYLANANSYKDFLRINSYDTRFPEPVITITPGNLNKNSEGEYSLPLTFKQTLRSRDSNGNIVNTNKQATLGTYTYNFVNSDGKIEQVTDKTQIPTSLLNLLPSKVTLKDVEKYLFKTSNVDGLQYTLSPDDINGILNVTINVPYMWQNGQLKSGLILTYSFGSEGNPFFKSDSLALYDTSVSLVTKSFIEDTNNTDISNTLKLKYSTTLPSEVSKEDYLADFVKMGAAYTNIALINSGEIILPTDSNITVTPIDKEGVAIVEVVFPKVGEKTNVTYSFETANVFKSNIYANENFYFMFKNNDEVLNYKVSDNQTYEKYQATQIASVITSASSSEKRDVLSRFANFSNYFGNLLTTQNSSGEDLIKIQAKGDDLAGATTITVTLTEDLPNVESKVFTQVYTGFNRQNTNVVAAISGFKFADQLSSTVLSKAPSEVTEDDLKVSNVFVYSGSASSLEKQISITPINTNGSLEVTILFKNWIEEQRTVSGTMQRVIVPEKRFTRVYYGLKATADPLDMVVWKSYDELDQQYRTQGLPSDIVSQIKSTNPEPLDQLRIFSNLTKNLETYLTNTDTTTTGQKPLEVNLSFNDSLGSITIVASILMNQKTQVFNSTISGFGTSNTDFGIIMVRNDSQAAESIKNKLASEITDTDIGKLYSLTSGIAFEKQITTSFDDTKGTLSLNIKLVDSTGQVRAESNATYSGFKTNVPEYRGTNWLIFGLAFGIPIVVLMIPILFIKLYLVRRDMKKFSKKLDSRLTEQSKVKKSKNVRTIKDLLDR
ncbi:lipoprotein 17-related variable surface protein [Malacoplasma muris]|uniref:lipoprotein 17-related variable surface protein n=1 Tax=Malacoplasma muris TaxID=2119 RepID=UPI00398F0EED